MSRVWSVACGSDGQPLTVAQRKAVRERLRRERIKDRFAQLASLIDPTEEPNTDKLQVLVDAIKLVNHLRQQVYELKELNKYLYERTTKAESARSYQLMVQSLTGGGRGEGAGPSEQPTPPWAAKEAQDPDPSMLRPPAA